MVTTGAVTLLDPQLIHIIMVLTLLLVQALTFVHTVKVFVVFNAELTCVEI